MQLEDSQRGVGKQRSQVNNFIAASVDAIIVTLMDTSIADAVAREAGLAFARASLPFSASSCNSARIGAGSAARNGPLSSVDPPRAVCADQGAAGGER